MHIYELALWGQQTCPQEWTPIQAALLSKSPCACLSEGLLSLPVFLAALHHPVWVFCFVFVVLEIEPGISHMLGKHARTKLLPTPILQIILL